jgi:TolB-like protein/Tfp pilus assembly protein PilF
MSLLRELKRRNVFRVALLYVVAGWVLLQAGDLLFGMLGLPGWANKLLFAFLLLGLPLALIFSWVYELTPEGLKREHEVERHASITTQTAVKMDVLTSVLVVAAIGLLVGKWYLDRRTNAPVASSATVNRASLSPTKTVSAAVVSIAVLPFVNMSNDKDNDYFSDGLSEELLNVLANVQGLRVIARTSSFSFRGKDVTIGDVARTLNVDHVLEGSVRKSGNRVRITTQLIRASDSSHLWSQTYDRDLNDIFAVQDEISSEVADALRVQLLNEGKPTAEAGGTSNPKAYEAYLRGLFLYNKGFAEASLRASLAAYDEAIRLDPRYARAHASRALAMTRLTSNGYEQFQTGFENARASAKRAIELAPDLAEGYMALAFILQVIDGDWNGAAAATNRAAQLNPGSAEIQRSRSGLESSRGHHENAIAAAEKDVELDPVAAAAHTSLAYALFAARRNEESEAAARRAITLQPDRSGGHAALSWALFEQHRFDEALEEADKESIDWQRMTGRAMVFAATGKTALARAELAAMQKKFGDTAAYQYAEINAALRENEEAFRWLAVARRVHDPGLTGNIFVDPALDPLRSDPRFDALLHELGFVG